MFWDNQGMGHEEDFKRARETRIALKKAKAELSTLRAENERLREALKAWLDACVVQVRMEGPIVNVAYGRVQVAYKMTCDALGTDVA
jgi:hypothetical protein